MKVYAEASLEIEWKADESPLTVADKRAHQIIKNRLALHGLPMISEEGEAIPYAERNSWKRLWMVDPLDGTKEFIKRNDEFTVNIALIDQHRPVLGIVYAPVARILYYASVEMGAFRVDACLEAGFEQGTIELDDKFLDALFARGIELPCTTLENGIYTIVGSRSHATDDLLAYVEEKKREKGRVNFIKAGSSLKICQVAEGAADLYPRLGPTMEWDTAAGQAVAECAGARMYDYHSKNPLRYNKADLLNPWFIVER